MSTVHIVFLAIGAAALVAGGAMLLRPDFVRGLIGLARGEAASYALRIAGGMIGAFGLALGGFVLAANTGTEAAQ